MWYMRWRGYIEQNHQGTCPHCGAHVMDFLKSKSGGRTEADFKNVLGYSLDSIKKGEITILLECLECFEKSYFHIWPYWIKDYPWLRNIDTGKVLTGRARTMEFKKAMRGTEKGSFSALGRRLE
jgi:ssDNA-binding Zn-finger/Zn-ribbon topoisomerase 1